MKTLYLLRHADAAPDSALPDHERPLTNEGRRTAGRLGDFMGREGLAPDVVLCSTARRTRETWERIAPQVGEDATVIYEEQLYGASVRRILDVVGRVAESAERLLVVGHNPGLEELAEHLTDPDGNGGDPTLGNGFPAGALAVMEARVSQWRELEEGRCALVGFTEPRHLEDRDERE